MCKAEVYGRNSNAKAKERNTALVWGRKILREGRGACENPLFYCLKLLNLNGRLF